MKLSKVVTHYLLAGLVLIGMPLLAQAADTMAKGTVVKSTNKSSAVNVQRSTKSAVTPTRDTAAEGRKAAEPRAAVAVKEVEGKEQVDEGILWALIRNEQYDSVYATMANIKKSHPEWKPSAKLIDVLENNHTDYLINQGQQRHKWNQVVDASTRYPKRFDCEHNYRRLALANALVRLRQYSTAKNVYAAVINECGEDQRIEAMEHASTRLPATQFNRLQYQASKKPMSGRGKSRLAAIEVRNALNGKPTAQELAKLTAREGSLLASKDIAVANTLAWANLEHGKPEHALELFRLSRSWKDNDEALKGEILALHRLHRSQDALALIQSEDKRIAEHHMEKDVLPLKAAACGDAKDYACQAASLEQLADIRPLDSGEHEALAWANFQLQKYDVSGQQFEALYREDPTENHAQGLYLSLQRQGKEARAAELSHELGGPLQGQLVAQRQQQKNSEAGEFFGRDLFHSAQAIDESYDNALPNVDTTFVRVGGMNRIRSGLGAQPMIHTFKISKFFTEGGYFFDKEQSLTARVERVFVDAGSPLPEALSIGTLPALPVLPLVAPSAIPTYLNGYEWEIEYRNEGWNTYYANIGQSFIGGGIKATWKGLLGTRRQYDQGFFGAEAYRQPNREKLLPYAGLLDPYTGQYWGRVMRNGVKVLGYHGLWDDIPATFDERTGLGLYYELGAEVLNGVGVKTNNHYYMALALPWTFDMDMPWGASVSIAPLIRYEHYKQDQDHFTYGHGGYFSPQYSFTPGVNLYVESHESEVVNYMFNAFVGHHKHKHNSSPILPFTPGVPTIEGINYLGGNVQEWTYSFRFAAVAELTEHFQLGGEVGYGQSSYVQAGVPFHTKDLSYLLYLTWNVDQRHDTLSTDRAVYGISQRYGTQPLF